MQRLRIPILLAVFLLLVAGGLGLFFRPQPKKNTNPSLAHATYSLKPFTSAKEMSAYLNNGYNAQSSALETIYEKVNKFAKSHDDSGGSLAPNTASDNKATTTNIQVRGIDEPDTVKTDGAYIYLSSDVWGVYNSTTSGASGFATPNPSYVSAQGEVSVVQALPVSALATKSILKDGGKLLLSGSTLIVQNYQTITGYDVSNPLNPVQNWQATIDTGTQLLQSRMYQGNLYFVMSKYTPEGDTPCPIQPMTGVGISYKSISCTDIYHPTYSYGNDVTYIVTILNTATGDSLATTAVMGNSFDSIVYMSKNALYLAYYHTADQVAMSLAILQESLSPLSASAKTKLKKLEGYDLSPTAKYVEMENILNGQTAGMSDKQVAEFYTTISTLTQNYIKAHIYTLDATDIVKISLDTAAVLASGSVSGKVVNQYAFDEYEGNLRVATTIGDSFSPFISGASSSPQWNNEVLVLNGQLKQIGAVSNLGLQEKIYSARFVGNKGYVVTFRQTDPLYVINLTDPANPVKSGELKVPGVSTYLHPLTDNYLLGIGRENAKVKVSLFDVSNPTTPVELDTVVLDTYWSDAEDDPHAFLQDDKFSAFFLPGSSVGYVFTYSGGKLHQVAKVDQMDNPRALYLNDNLYVIGGQSIVVFNENSWAQIGSMTR
jgi:uncharacterized secreted protein with C-terminal beta-propeller domain